MLTGLMGDQPLGVRLIFERMRTVHGTSGVVDAAGRSTYAEIGERVLRVARVLQDLGVRPGDRVATFANNSIRHLELYYAVPLVGAVLHMVNIRLHDDQIGYVVRHAGDEVVVVDDDLLDRLQPALVDAPEVRAVLTMTELSEKAASVVPLADLPDVDERAACGICYTSGTTGMPKGVLYSHRSTFLHALAAGTTSSLGIGEADRILQVVPLFHANGWGLPYSAPFVGADLVYVGADTSPENLARVIAAERVTYALGVPTIWTQLLPLLRSGQADLSSLRTVGVGGSAVPRALLEEYDAHGVTILQLWGMTETSPLAAASRPRRRHAGLSAAELQAVRLRTGTISPGVEARVVGDDGRELPWDGTSIGELQCRGPWVATDYYADPASAEKFQDGWLRTGDMVVVEPDGYFTIVDRAKDVIKSGGEWISSVELEGAVLGHPGVREAAVVGCASERWDERPVLFVVPEDPDRPPSLADLQGFLAGQVAKWWVPDDLVLVAEIPKTSVGKFDKKVMRGMLADRVLP